MFREGSHRALNYKTTASIKRVWALVLLLFDHHPHAIDLYGIIWGGSGWETTSLSLSRKFPLASIDKAQGREWSVLPVHLIAMSKLMGLPMAFEYHMLTKPKVILPLSWSTKRDGNHPRASASRQSLLVNQVITAGRNQNKCSNWNLTNKTQRFNSLVLPPCTMLQVWLLKYWAHLFLQRKGKRTCTVEDLCCKVLGVNRATSSTLTGICGKVMVTSSPLPTRSSPSQDVSIEAGLKSSKEENNGDYVSKSPEAIRMLPRKKSLHIRCDYREC